MVWVDAGTDAAIDAGLDGDDRLFVPEGLPNTNANGEDVGLALVAFTLFPGANGPSFYAAVQNVWSTPLCEAGMMLDFFDTTGQAWAAGPACCRVAVSIGSPTARARSFLASLPARSP